MVYVTAFYDNIHIINTLIFIELGSWISIVTGNWVDGWYSIPGRGKGFSSSLCFQTLCGPPSILLSGYWGPFMRVKHGPGVLLTTPPSLLVLRLIMSRSYTSSLVSASIDMQGDGFTILHWFSELIGILFHICAKIVGIFPEVWFTHRK